MALQVNVAMSQQIINVPVQLPGPLLSQAPVPGKPRGHIPPRAAYVEVLAGRKMNRLQRTCTYLYGSLDAQIKNISALIPHIATVISWLIKR